MRLIPFRTRYTRSGDILYEFNVESSQRSGFYIVEITIDELDDDLIVSKTCECPAKTRFQKEINCKHITQCLGYLKNYMINFREEENA